MKDLYDAALAVLDNSYSTYSKFKVAAALRLRDGSIITGVNVENASYGLSNCAERTALFTAYTKGYRKQDIKEIVITTNSDKIIAPCGACRQVMRELMPDDAMVHMVHTLDNMKSIKNSELLPHAFTEGDL